jgi:hypothetical protein
MKKFRTVLLIVVLSILLIGGAASAIAVFGTYSKGSRAGKIVKFSKKGILFKTYEGQLGLGTVSQTPAGELSSGLWEFSVYRGDDEIIEAINSAMDHGQTVKLHYEEKYFQFDWRGDTKYFITKVDKVTAQP